MLNTPFSPWPSYTPAEIEKVAQVLASNKVNYWTGTEGRLFEKEFAHFSNTEHAVVVANGTIALICAWKALGIGPGDEVIVPARTYVVSASSVLLMGATPVFADVDRDSQNITAGTVAGLITPRTKAICCVHLAGWACDMDALRDVADAHKIALVEDCAQAHGAKWRGKPVGSQSDIAAWSFCQDKIITTGGEGGMVTTHNIDYWHSIWSYKDHGKSWFGVYEKEHPPGLRWVHDSVGINGRLPEMQSAIGRIQLNLLPEWTKQRTGNANRILDVAERSAGLRIVRPPVEVQHAWYKAYVFIRPEALKSGWSRDRVIEAIQQHGVPCDRGSCPEVYLEKCFSDAGLTPSKRLPVAAELGENSLMFLVHPTLSDDDIDKTCDTISYVMEQATLKMQPEQSVYSPAYDLC